MDGAQGGDRPERPALVTALELDNDVLSARIAARACPARSRTMRYACGWFVRTSLMCAALLAILYGYRYAEAFGVKRDGAGGSSTVSSPVATPPTTPGDATGSPMPETGENPPTKTIEYKNGVLTTTTWPVPGFSPPPPPRGAVRH